ncbi:hypothetical protein FB567DRAFT_555594 [Paraphoma chrysanthemicola]|uniref:Uncharacterized protein n=1 Tax=Paraphoma chrysanthemicola TaxID=798071 RepID=A0A8K0QTG7_9PLEO|nr:hypothetical protein FB567DRAFT_555594 [Paraphoma chrysanthemicola]
MSSRRDQEFTMELPVEATTEPDYDMDEPFFCSDEPGDVEDLSFTAEEFTSAILRVGNGPFTSDNEHFTRVVQMYSRMDLLHISPERLYNGHIPDEVVDTPLFDHSLYHSLPGPVRDTDFGLPFPVEDFLTILEQTHEHYSTVKSPETALIPNRWVGSSKLFWRMLTDLVARRTNMIDFLADRIPAHLETCRFLLMLLATLNADATVNKGRLRVSLFAPGGSDRTGRLWGPLSHLQATVFVQSLRRAEANVIAWLVTEEMFDVVFGDHETSVAEEWALFCFETSVLDVSTRIIENFGVIACMHRCIGPLDLRMNINPPLLKVEKFIHKDVSARLIRDFRYAMLAEFSMQSALGRETPWHMPQWCS